ncbi:unnamed protein product [Ilex paraguariensis]|uniref:Uncharacterized protein n=1 Tax=Ilex paraguariensis TaxID=185542 RepID=A0ABC8RH02_9AQUA
MDAESLGEDEKSPLLCSPSLAWRNGVVTADFADLILLSLLNPSVCLDFGVKAKPEFSPIYKALTDFITQPEVFSSSALWIVDLGEVSCLLLQPIEFIGSGVGLFHRYG